MSFTTRRGPVVVDTGVFGARLTTQGRLLATRYSPILDDRPAIISFITVAELRFGAHHAGWGLPRRQRLETQITQATIVWPSNALIDAYASLRHWTLTTGHGLGQKDHEADRWIAATALHLGIPLISHDAIFTNVANLDLITAL